MQWPQMLARAMNACSNKALSAVYPDSHSFRTGPQGGYDGNTQSWDNPIGGLRHTGSIFYGPQTSDTVVGKGGTFYYQMKLDKPYSDIVGGSTKKSAGVPHDIHLFKALCVVKRGTQGAARCCLS